MSAYIQLALTGGRPHAISIHSGDASARMAYSCNGHRQIN